MKMSNQQAGCCFGFGNVIAAVARKNRRANNAPVNNAPDAPFVRKPPTALRELPILLPLPSQSSLKDSKPLDNPKLQQQRDETTKMQQKPLLLEDDLKDPSQIWFWDEEDMCPICLDGYDPENPNFVTECGHHYHLACILEWAERQQTCPMCDKEMLI